MKLENVKLPSGYAWRPENQMIRPSDVAICDGDGCFIGVVYKLKTPQNKPNQRKTTA